MTEDEVVGWHHRLNGQGFGWTPGVDDGQGGLACCSPWGHKESDRTERLNWTELGVWEQVQPSLHFSLCYLQTLKCPNDHEQTIFMKYFALYRAHAKLFEEDATLQKK